jgi:hypothetical protein
VEGHAVGEAGRSGVLLGEWRAEVRETRRVLPQPGDYDPAHVEGAVDAFLPLVPLCCRDWVLEGGRPGILESEGVVATIGFETAGEDLPPEETRAVGLRLAREALQGLAGDEEILHMGESAGSAARARLFLPGGRARAEEIATRLSARLTGLQACGADVEEGRFRLSLEGVDERRWLRVDRLSVERRG